MKHVRHNLHRALSEVMLHWDFMELEEFPKEVSDMIDRIHCSDKSGTAFRYTGELTTQAERVNFPGLVTLLDENFNLLCSVYDAVGALFDAVPEPSEYY